MPTIGAFIQLLPASFQGLPYRATDGTVYCIVEGRGESRVGESVFEWEPHDIFVVPSWCRVSHHADEEAVLFSYSDRPVQKALGLWREEAPTEAEPFGLVLQLFVHKFAGDPVRSILAFVAAELLLQRLAHDGFAMKSQIVKIFARVQF